jgi:thiol-disulfide isomerase/thioredoxin
MVINNDNLPRTGGGISVVGGGANGTSGSGSGSGRMVLMDFWASWCGPCRQSVPQMKGLLAKYGDDQLEVIGVNEDDNQAAGQNFAAQNQMNWEQEFDAGGRMARQYGVSGFPTFILLDADGKVVQRFVGESPSEPLVDRIGPYLKKAPKGI